MAIACLHSSLRSIASSSSSLYCTCSYTRQLARTLARGIPLISEHAHNVQSLIMVEMSNVGGECGVIPLCDR